MCEVWFVMKEKYILNTLFDYFYDLNGTKEYEDTH